LVIDVELEVSGFMRVPFCSNLGILGPHPAVFARVANKGDKSRERQKRSKEVKRKKDKPAES